MPQPDDASLARRLREFGQQHLLAFWHDLTADEQRQLAQDIDDVDFARLDDCWRRRQSSTDWAAVAERALPPPAVRLSDRPNSHARREARMRGERALAEGRVAAVLVAGGQGTRLGFPHPKGMYAIGPVSGATLFQIFLEKLLAVSYRYHAPVVLYLMTSPATHDETASYLASNARFGLPASDVHLFCQGTMPAVDARNGRVLLAEKHRVALSPDGHGGMLSVLAASGGLDDLQRRGIDTVFYFQVDNPLTRVCDPEFLGHHLLAGAEVSTQAVAKRTPEDRMGNIVEVDGRVRIIEYSDLPRDAARRRQPDGSLVLWAGSIAVHAFDVGFLRRAMDHGDALPFHTATKKVSCVDAAGNVVDLGEPNAIKFERFIFDLLAKAERSIVVEVDRATDFAPVKNAPGADSDAPEHTRSAMMALHASWLRDAGAEVLPGVPVEISPHFALDAEECRERIKPGTVFNSPTYLSDDKGS